MTPDEARAIVQNGLDRHGEATMAGDIDAMAEFSDVPCEMETLSGKAVATTAAEMRDICRNFADTLRMGHLTHLVRRCLEAKFKDPDTIWAIYETRFLRNGIELVGEPYMSFLILNRHADGWKFASIQLLVSEGDPFSSTVRERLS